MYFISKRFSRRLCMHQKLLNGQNQNFKVNNLVCPKVKFSQKLYYQKINNNYRESFRRVVFEIRLVAAVMGNSGLKQHYETAKKTGTLNLSQGKLDEFPQNLRALASLLRTLDLSKNKFVRIPNDIGNFTLLKQLNISHNKLTELPEVLGALTKLEGLNAASNQIKSIPWSLSKLTRLKQVNLSDNQIIEFPLMFRDLKFLDMLDLSRNRITTIPDAVAALHVVELNLNQNQISAISEKLAECPRLKTLRLEENCLQLNAIPIKILKDSNVSVLALEGNLFEMKEFADMDGYDNYMERYTAVKKKMF